VWQAKWKTCTGLHKRYLNYVSLTVNWHLKLLEMYMKLICTWGYCKMLQYAFEISSFIKIILDRTNLVFIPTLNILLTFYSLCLCSQYNIMLQSLSVTCSRSVLFSTNKTDRHDITEILFQLYHGKNNLFLNEIMMMSALCKINTLSWILSSL
jgi:hypothetical protein